MSLLIVPLIKRTLRRTPIGDVWYLLCYLLTSTTNIVQFKADMFALKKFKDCPLMDFIDILSGLKKKKNL